MTNKKIKENVNVKFTEEEAGKLTGLIDSAIEGRINNVWVDANKDLFLKLSIKIFTQKMNAMNKRVEDSIKRGEL